MKLFKHHLTTLSFCLLLAFNAQSKIIEDVKGNRVEIPDNTTRIANLWHANNQVQLFLNGADKLVATSSGPVKSPWFRIIYPRITEVPVVTNGQTIQMEELLKHSPQIALISSPTMAEELRLAGVPHANVSFITFDAMKKSIRVTADVIGGNAPQIAQEYIQELDGNIAFIEQRIRHLKQEEKPLVLHIVDGTNLLKVDGGKSIVGDWIITAGGRNALPDQGNMVEVSMEELLQANPDVIIIGSGNSEKAQEALNKMQQDPLWKNVNAVKNQRVYVNPKGIYTWDRYSTEEALQLLWAAKLLHPNLFTDVNMIEKTQQFYKKYYHYDLSDEQAKIILQGLNP